MLVIHSERRETRDEKREARGEVMEGGADMAKISISGFTLSAILNRASSAPADIDGLLFGSAHYIPVPLSDSDADPPPSPLLVPALYSHLAFPSLLTFYDHLGQLRLPLPLPHPADPHPPLLGWFVSRRRSPLRPSAREHAISAALARTLPPASPLLFLLLSPSPTSSSIHTHQYRAFQFFTGSGPRVRFEPKSMAVLNIGPGFRPNYVDFSPRSPFPLLPVLEVSDGSDKTLRRLKNEAKEQQEMDACAQGYEVGRLSTMVAAHAPCSVSNMEDVYASMLTKLDRLAGDLATSSSRLRLQENYVMDLRKKVAGLK